MSNAISIRRANERGHANHGWLDTWHTFSFGSYHDRNHMGFRSLRVINEDWVAPGEGFGTHPHKDMEIVTYVLSGSIEHRDSMGNGEVLHPGEFQRMSAGTGITHSEFNPSSTDPLHLYQIWLLPESKGIQPSYEQKKFPVGDRFNQFRLVASQDAREGSLLIQTDASIYLAELKPESRTSWKILQNRSAWMQVLSGEVTLTADVPFISGEADGKYSTLLQAGDGISATEPIELVLKTTEKAELMLFDLG